MSRWTAVSDRDYFDEISGPHEQFIDRPCAICGRIVWIARNEPYLIRIACDRCQQKELKQ